jgi:hypothetical protein
MLLLLFTECTHDTTAVYTILKAVYAEAKAGHREITWASNSQAFLTSNVQRLDWLLHRTDLCAVLVEHWTEGVAPVLQYLCETFSISGPTQAITYECLIRKEPWCLGVSGHQWKTASSLPKDEVVAMARTCLSRGMGKWMAHYPMAQRFDPHTHWNEAWNIAGDQRLLQVLRGTAVTGT